MMSGVEQCREIMRVVLAQRMPVRELSCTNVPHTIGTFPGLLTVIVLDKPKDTHFMILETPILLRCTVGDIAHHAKDKV